MTEVSLELVMAQFNRMFAEMRGLREQIADLRTIVRGVEAQLVGMRRDVAIFTEAQAAESVRLDRLAQRVERIERRLDLVE